MGELKVLAKVNLGVPLKFLVFANIECLGCEVYFPINSEKLILKPLKLLFFVSCHNLRMKNGFCIMSIDSLAHA